MKLNKDQRLELLRIWKLCGGTEELANQMLYSEMEYFLDHTPMPTVNKQKIETDLSHRYMKVIERAKALTEALAYIPEGDRVNQLATYISVPELGGRISTGDPLENFLAFIELAEFQRDELKHTKKYERQLNELKTFLGRFPPFKEISRENFLDLAITIWPGAGWESISRAYRPWKKKLELNERISILNEKYKKDTDHS